MSGPVAETDAPSGSTERGEVEGAVVELLASRDGTVGALPIRRALPRRHHRTLGAWCFADHMGPAAVTERQGVDVAPHPHIGLQTVTWLTAGEVLHRDSLGTEQVVRAGQLNLMTAGAGVSHSEESTGRYRGPLQGIQLWVAQPEATRHGAAAFEHHATLPQVEVGHGTATVLVGALDGTASPARRDTDHLGAELDLRPGRSVLPLRPTHEYGLVVLEGTVEVDRTDVAPGHLGYLGTGRDELALTCHAPATAILLGGEPFPEEILMWWNFVARDRSEVEAARAAWEAGDARFGTVASPLPRTPAPRPPWMP